MFDSNIHQAVVVVAVLCISLSLSGCGGCGPEGPVQQAIRLIDRAINDINIDSTKWRSALQEISGQLPANIQSTVRNEITELARRSVQAVGIESRCDVDFLARRAIEGLQHVKEMLTNSSAPEIVSPPEICLVSPPALDLNLAPASRPTIVIDGYDLDHIGSDDQPLRAYLISGATGEKIELDKSRITQNLHYHQTINVGGQDFENFLRQRGIVKIQYYWGADLYKNHDGVIGEVVIIAKAPQVQDPKENPIGAITDIPPHDWGGDKDFDTNKDNPPVTYKVRAISGSDGKTIKVSLSMLATEGRADWTRVDSTGNSTGKPTERTVYTAPAGWRILTYSPNTESKAEGSVNDQGVPVHNLGAGELVRQFTVYVDHKGDDAGTYTRVEAVFNSLMVTLTEDWGLEWGVCRTGSAYSTVPIPKGYDQVTYCRNKCYDDIQCKAWSYSSTLTGPKPGPKVCELKNAVPEPTNSQLCVSGVR